MRSCNRCGAPLAPDAPRYYRLCLGCFKEQQKEEEDAIKRERDHWKQRYYDAARAQSSAPAGIRQALVQAGFTEGAIKKMIILCHPDRHGNSQTANQITAMLLDLRRHLKK